MAVKVKRFNISWIHSGQYTINLVIESENGERKKIIRGDDNIKFLSLIEILKTHSDDSPVFYEDLGNFDFKLKKNFR